MSSSDLRHEPKEEEEKKSRDCARRRPAAAEETEDAAAQTDKREGPVRNDNTENQENNRILESRGAALCFVPVSEVNDGGGSDKVRRACRNFSAASLSLRRGFICARSSESPKSRKTTTTSSI